MNVTLPDGSVIQNVPDGMSRADLIAKLGANGYDTSKLTGPGASLATDPITQGAINNPTAPSSGSPSMLSQAAGWLGKVAPSLGPVSGLASAIGNLNSDDSNSNFLSGVGAGMAKVGRAVGLGGMGLGLPATQAEADKLNVPLMNTTAGAAGNVVGQTAAVAPTMFIPGANTVAGAALIGAGVGAATTEGDANARLAGALGGGVGGLGGNLLGKGIGAAAGALATRRTASIAADAAAAGGKPAAAQAAQAAGYVLPPTEINPSLLNSALEGLSGKIKTSQAASQSNQQVTNQLAQRALGLPTDRPITPDALSTLRQTAGQNYQALSDTGTVIPGQDYSDALDQIIAPYVNAQRSFPNAPPSPVIDQINALRTPQFDAGDALDQIKNLRSAADTAYGQQNNVAGKSLKSAANALEAALDSHVSTLQNAAEAFQSAGDAAPGVLPDYAAMLDNFRSARQTIAKSYSVQKALNGNGDVSAPNLAAQAARGTPLSGELATIAQTAQSFPKATQMLSQNYNMLSPLDYAGAVIAGAHNPMAAAGIGLRPLVRSAILSGPYQRFAMPSQPSPTNALYELLSGSGVTPAAQLGGMSIPDFLQMPTTVIRGSPN